MHYLPILLIAGLVLLPDPVAAQEPVASARFVELEPRAFFQPTPERGLSPAPGATESAFRMEPRYPLMGALIGGVAGAAVAAMRASTSDGPVPYLARAAWYVPAGALAGLAVGLYIGATAEE